jgi:hypothetical protein
VIKTSIKLLNINLTQLIIFINIKIYYLIEYSFIYVTEESRKKKFGKKKKKHVQKLLLIAMLLKSKISLLLQLLSTHFQVKFFVIAILSLLMNAARFWLDLKKSHRPSKVIYYEHAQHQHHYDHDDDHGIWGRSSDEAPQELAYSAYIPEH